MADTVRSTPELLSLIPEGHPGNTTIQFMRDLVTTMDVTRSISVNVMSFARGLSINDGVTDASAAVTAAQAAANAIVGGQLLFPPGTYLSSVTLAPVAGTRISGYGATYLYSGAGTAVQQGVAHFALEGIKIQKSGAAGSSIGLAVGTSGLVGHYSFVRDVEITGFNDGVVDQLSFYGGFYSVNSHANITRNWRFTNTSISNDCFGCLAKGEGVTLVGVQVDDTTTNSASVRWHGGTIEGNLVQNVDILGADNTVWLSPHVEQNPPVALAGTVTATNASTAVTGAGTAFLSAVKQGQYIKLDADGNTAWMRVASITNDTALTLTEAYQGTGGASAGSVVGGNFRISSAAGAAINNRISSPELAIGSGTCPGIYVQAASNTMIDIGDMNLPLLLGANASRTKVWASTISGGLDDRGPDTHMFADSDNGRWYIKRGLVKRFLITVGGTDTLISTGQNLKGDSTIECLTAYKVNGTQVVSARNAGWTAQTAGASKADLGAAPTVNALASWARSIQDMLTTHGLLGP